MRPGDLAQATILAFEAELTEAGLLPLWPGGPVEPLPPSCGTPQAAWRHRKHGEELDGWCADAEREYGRGRLAIRRASARPLPARWGIPVTTAALDGLDELIAALAMLIDAPDDEYTAIASGLTELGRAA